MDYTTIKVCGKRVLGLRRAWLCAKPVAVALMQVRLVALGPTPQERRGANNTVMRFATGIILRTAVDRTSARNLI